MHRDTIDLVAGSTTCAELAQTERRGALRADLMGLADELDRHRDIARLIATADLGELPSIVREHLDSLPEVFEQLTAFVDNELLEHLDVGEETPS